MRDSIHLANEIFEGTGENINEQRNFVEEEEPLGCCRRGGQGQVDP